MGRYTDLPTLNVDFLKPTRMSFDTKGGGLEGGRNGLGESVTIETSGGGVLVGSYEGCVVTDREQHEYVNWIAARMNSSVRFMNVPILSDWMGPFPVVNGIPQSTIGGIPHSDGAQFSDGAGYSQPTVIGTIAAAGLNAGQIYIRVYGASRKLRWSDWFSIYHPTKGWRAYRYFDPSDPKDAFEVIDGVLRSGKQYLVSLDRPLREAVVNGTRVKFDRPLCVMKFPASFSLAWEAEGWWQSSPTLQFVEGF
ncbi:MULTISPECIES: hypothetical protein [Mesorhizobium]|uniref:Uncharacterized protein n=2 Tax=Mesorhizobium TaxID=68287 RepID=A0A1A5HVG1_RHILI|nr:MULTISPECIES: hypothetical protein [Mesorhizobium]ETA72344.1 hypothetical protein MesloDRAFT_1214 [Mesorhizobium japonicum R7A]MBE1709675.1 hypothetical protein [Mesorhizobium japonicum]MBE1714344.1 hypothetical protein [Mesorhizobium japonicum]MUT25324.1 hypothetical protein [Mesorhizobium japonicum]MUT28622.1 hypothetical protein [Mesorhizobium japonicum]